jgi:magnesium transporter
MSLSKPIPRMQPVFWKVSRTKRRSPSRCLEIMGAKEVANIASNIPVGFFSHLLRRVEERQRKAILSELPQDISQQLFLLLKYGEGTAGDLMDTQVFTLPDDITVREAFKRVRRYSAHMILYIFIVNREQHLVGFITIPQLMTAPPHAYISSIMEKPVGRLSPEMSRRAILANPGWHEVHALPVVDDKGVFLGAIGYRTIHQLERETKEISPLEMRDDVFSAFGELYWSALFTCLKEMASVLKGSGATPAGQERK